MQISRTQKWSTLKGSQPARHDDLLQLVTSDLLQELGQKLFKYGTAGFRTKGKELEKVCFRVGILVALRAKLTSRVGVMITASHNQKDDNGVKIIDSDGSMLD